MRPSESKQRFCVEAIAVGPHDLRSAQSPEPRRTSRREILSRSPYRERHRIPGPNLPTYSPTYNQVGLLIQSTRSIRVRLVPRAPLCCICAASQSHINELIRETRTTAARATILFHLWHADGTIVWVPGRGMFGLRIHSPVGPAAKRNPSRPSPSANLSHRSVVATIDHHDLGKSTAPSCTTPPSICNSMVPTIPTCAHDPLSSADAPNPAQDVGVAAAAAASWTPSQQFRFADLLHISLPAPAYHEQVSLRSIDQEHTVREEPSQGGIDMEVGESGMGIEEASENQNRSESETQNEGGSENQSESEGENQSESDTGGAHRSETLSLR